MFFIVSDKKFFMKPEYSVIQNFVMTHSYKCTIADVLSEEKMFNTVDLLMINSERIIWFCSMYKPSRVGRKKNLNYFLH